MNAFRIRRREERGLQGAREVMGRVPMKGQLGGMAALPHPPVLAERFRKLRVEPTSLTR